MPRDLQRIRRFSELIDYLRDELDWPTENFAFEDLTFEYEPAELGLKDEEAVKVKTIHQLRPLHQAQPWGIFFVEFGKKRIPIVVLRRILRHLVFEKRASANKSERPAWQARDLLFISATGEHTDRELSFAHFVEREETGLAELRVLGWDTDDTPLHMDYVAETLSKKLRWRDAYERDPEAWRKEWSSAFLLRQGHVIRTAQELASALAGLARNLRARIRTILRAEDGFGEIRKLQRAFRDGLIHDLDDEGFADMFAQTVAYGLFSLAARRTIPGNGTAFVKEDLTHYFTSPFLKEMLGVFLGLKSRRGKIDFDELGVSDVSDLLTSPDTHMEVILADFNNKTRGEDPVIHFYEHFLNAYNKQLKIQRGVFYTPQPVVSYIVRSVHELLQTEFGLADGLADITTWGEMVKKHPGLKLPPLTDEPGEKRTISSDEAFVQILDPATGTATFLVEVIDIIYRTLAAKWKQQRLTDAQQHTAWNNYVPQHLLPRLHAFELMMAPYAIAHMKVGLKLAETGYRFGTEERARIYLTNALEPKVKQLPMIGFEALAHEAADVNKVKWNKRFTVVIGNPPYSNFGQLNKIPFILNLLEDYKRGLDERKINLDDDFIKFLRFSQHLLDETGVGVFGMITNNVFIDGITHRRVRESLKSSFSNIRILDLHGSSKKLEASPDGTKEENVFDIQQGVGISLFIKSPLPNTRTIQHAELWGARETKYRTLRDTTACRQTWAAIDCTPPHFFFVPKSFTGIEEYRQQPSIAGEVFAERNAGIQTKRDGLVYSFTKDELEMKLSDIRSFTASALSSKYELPEDGRDWAVEWAKQDLSKGDGDIIQVAYHPFDARWTYFTGRTKGFMAYPRTPLMWSALQSNRLLLTVRNPRRGNIDSFFVGTMVVDKDAVSPFDNVSFFPLYIYPDSRSTQRTLDIQGDRRVNLVPSFLRMLCKSLGLAANGREGLPSGLTPEDIFHYAYAVFHSPGYRSRYAEFLKIDFPRLPLTASLEMFRTLAQLGGELTALHMLVSPKLSRPITDYIGVGNPEVEKISWSKNTVWIDRAQATGFRGVREDVWTFRIGGYQICEKWLKDRKGRILTKDDVTHYHKIVVALSDTIRLMEEIDAVIEKYGGWPTAFKIETAKRPVASVVAAMTYPSDETDKLICAVALCIVSLSEGIESMNHLDAVLLVTHRDWCRALLPPRQHTAYDAALARAPQALVQQNDQKIHWKRCRDYLEMRKAISVQRPGASERITRASNYGSVLKDFPRGVEELSQFALQALTTALKIRDGVLASASQEQKTLVQTIIRRSQEAELVA